MQILVHCEDPICCDAELIRRVEGVIAVALERFGEHLSRVEVRLRDLERGQSGDRNLVCSLEARLAGAPPINAEHEAATLAEAIHAAADQLERLIGRQMRNYLPRASNLRANMH